jgi:proton-dependent oligopeptide transporter, POT family
MGYKTPIVIGGILMGIGYCLMSIHSVQMLYVSMFFVIIGNGLFKPNISVLLGNLYNEERFKDKKDDGFNIFYMGINIGAFVCNIISAMLLNTKGYYAAFLAAGIGMFIGVIVFLVGGKHYAHAIKAKPKVEGERPLLQVLAIVVLPAILFAVIGGLIPIVLVKDKSTDAFLFACVPVIFFFGYILYSAPKEDKRRIAAMLAIFAAVVPFWAVFKQNGTTLTTWADKYTDREISSSLQPALSAMHLTDTIKYELSESNAVDQHFRTFKVLKNGKPLKDTTAKGDIKQVYRQKIQYPSYFQNLSENKKPKDGENLYAFNTNIFQSVNPLWVIILTPLVVAFFAFLRKRGREPSTPTKLTIGLLVTALSCLVMVWAVNASNNGLQKASYWWFFGSYGVITIGELFLSPMGLSLVSKLSPPRLTALMMGGWFIATSIGNKLSGVLASLWDGYENKGSFFWTNTFLLLAATLILALMLRWLNRIFKEYKV